MREQIEVIYENGAFRPLAPLPGHFRERQHFTLTIEETDETNHWLDEANPNVSLEEVRLALAKVSTSLAQAVSDERAER